MFRLLTLILTVILLASAALADNLIRQFGLTLPTPLLSTDDTLNPVQVHTWGGLPADYWLLPGDAVPIVAQPTKLELILFLSESGAVDSLHFLPLAREPALGFLRRSLLALKFSPAAVDGKSIPYQLPAELLLANERFFDISPRRRQAAVLVLPVIDEIGVVRRDLVERSFALNGIEMPQVESFPAYFCLFKIGEREPRYPFAVYKVSLDSSGHLLDFSEYCSSRPECAENFGRALLYAYFTPGRINGRNRPCEFYLTVRFFDQLQYPTRKWYNDSTRKDNSIYENFRLESSLSIDSVINPPLPVSTSSGVVTYNSPFLLVDTLRAFVKIDTLGKILAALYGAPEFTEVVSSGKKILANLEFIPARDLLDRKVEFRGELFMRFDGSNFSRIRFEWLPRRAQPDFY